MNGYWDFLAFRGGFSACHALGCQSLAGPTIGFVLGVRYWLAMVGLMVLLLVSAIIWVGGVAFILTFIVVGIVGSILRREHEIARVMKDAEDHPPVDLPE